MIKNITWRDIAFFVIALLIVSYLMVLGVIVMIDRLMYVSWDREMGTPTFQPVKFEGPAGVFPRALARNPY
jgi:heme/copper-type cytochrome/quinol oxidase subunit 1